MSGFSPITPDDIVTMYYDATELLIDPRTGNATTIVGNAEVTASLASNAAAVIDLPIGSIYTDGKGIEFEVGPGGQAGSKYNLHFRFSTSGGDVLNRTETLQVKASI